MQDQRLYTKSIAKCPNVLDYLPWNSKLQNHVFNINITQTKSIFKLKLCRFLCHCIIFDDRSKFHIWNCDSLNLLTNTHARYNQYLIIELKRMRYSYCQAMINALSLVSFNCGFWKIMLDQASFRGIWNRIILNKMWSALTSCTVPVKFSYFC